ncbi:hypothetical protein C0991_011714 [Blastosporella zonata]|nr:hypothetical protein C0991_011714 [Blastosporella zonata]
MVKSEDVVPTGYTYSWNSDSDLPLQDFLSKYKPSMVQNDGKKPWIWVQGSPPTQEDTGVDDALEEASALLKEVTEKVEAIKNDASIPVRSNKKTGAKSKKEVREQVQSDATEKLKEIAIKHGYVSGKWLIFASADKVDTIWSSIAKSLVSGPLATTFAHLAKVATSPESQDSSNHQHLLCVYIPNVYDKDKVTETWKNSALISDTEAKELKDAFFTDLASNKDASKEEPSAEANKDNVAVPTTTVAAPSKAKAKLKKKVADDPFASDNDDVDKDEEKRKQEVKAKVVKKPLPKKKIVDNPFASDDEDAAEAKRREEVQAKNANSTTVAKKRQVSNVDDDDGDDSEERPKKKKSAKSRR